MRPSRLSQGAAIRAVAAIALAVALAPASALDAQAAMDSARPVCFQVVAGSWTPALGHDSAHFRLPAWVRLETASVGPPQPEGARRLSPPLGYPPGIVRGWPPYWIARDSGRFELVWTDGFTQVHIIALRRHGP